MNVTKALHSYLTLSSTWPSKIKEIEQTSRCAELVFMQGKSMLFHGSKIAKADF